MRLPPLKAGIYRHYKGHLYLVMGYAHDANADTLRQTDELLPLGERAVVVYVGLQLDAAHTGPRMAVRTVEDFLAYVDPEDGSVVPQSVIEESQGSLRFVEQAGYVPRFQYAGATFNLGMLEDGK